MNREILMMENPVGGDMYGFGYPSSNPRRKRRNPKPKGAGLASVASAKTWKEWTQNVDLIDIGSGIAGLYGASAIPPMVIKDATTVMKKILKVGVGVGVAVATGALAKAMVSPAAGKAAVLGGLAGTTIVALQTFFNIQLGGSQIRALPAPRVAQRYPAPSTQQEFEGVRLA